MSPVVNFEGVKDQGELIPKGLYNARFSEFEEKDGDAGVYYNCMFVLDTDDPETNGRKVFNNVSVSEKSLPFFRKFCLALGADKEDFSGDVDTDEMMERLVGEECRVRITHKKIKDEDRIVHNVAAVLAPGFSN